MEELMKEEKEGVKAAEQEKPKKRRNRKKNRKNEMRKSYFAGMISMLAIVMIVLVGTTFLWPGSSADHPGGFWSWRKTAAIKAMISQLYAGDVDDTELSNAMYKGLISGLGDKYSTYYTKEEYEAIKTAQEGYYQGIGVTVTLDGDKLQVTGVQDDTPAAKAGIQADITPHTLRHSFAAHLLGNGADIHAVQAMMGHSDMATTQMYMNYTRGEAVRSAYAGAHPRN